MLFVWVNLFDVTCNYMSVYLELLSLLISDVLLLRQLLNLGCPNLDIVPNMTYFVTELMYMNTIIHLN